MRPSIITSTVIRVVIRRIVQQLDRSIPDVGQIDNKPATNILTRQLSGVIQFLRFPIRVGGPDLPLKRIHQPARTHSSIGTLNCPSTSTAIDGAQP